MIQEPPSTAPSHGPSLALRDVAVHFRSGASAALTLRIDRFDVAAGTNMLIHGASGRGKTTVLHLLAGLLVPATGEVRVGALDLCRLSEGQRSRLRRRDFGIIFQTLNLLDHLTPLENVQLAVGASAAARPRAMNALATVQMDALASARTATLSVGQRQRVAVARVLAAAPSVILADEPTSSLDDGNAAVIMDALFAASRQATLVMVSHDHRVRDRFVVTLGIDEVLAP